MISLREFLQWYEKKCKLAIKKGDLPKDVTEDEALSYMMWVYCPMIIEQQKEMSG